jgi:catechol 2,3-dioxygenase-like lactoylglutathione lyase family enzyme
MSDHPMDPREMALVAPEIFVPDVDAATRFCTERLGFSLLRREGDTDRAVFAVVARGPAVILIADEGHYPAMGGTPAVPRGAAIDVRVLVDDVDAVYALCRRNGVPMDLEIGDRYYGLRDFIVRDPHGFRIRFAAPRR